MVFANGQLNPALAQTNPPPVEEAINQVYQAALEHEMKEVGKRIIIVDASMGKTSFAMNIAENAAVLGASLPPLRGLFGNGERQAAAGSSTHAFGE